MKKLMGVVTFGGCFAFMASVALASAWQANGGSCIPTDKSVLDNAWWVVTGGGRFIDNPACGSIDLDSHLVWIEVLIHRETHQRPRRVQRRRAALTRGMLVPP